MKYRTTRGGIVGASFEETLFAGYASDGGLYVPDSLPEIPKALWSKWKESTPKYTEVVFEIVKLFVAEKELPRDILQSCIDQAYKEFDTEAVIEMQVCKTKPGQNPATYTVVEMFHGKTRSFKDYALSLVGKLMEYYVQKRGTHVTILVGTSSDTGSAAIEAVKGLKGVDIIVLYPKGKISRVQELQMITVGDDNVHVFETEGTSDDLDEPIKKSFPAPGLISINSVNWARIMIQIAHYVYISTLEKFEPVDIYVPTGGAGNVSAGLVATLLGCPINLFVAQNENCTVETLMNKGELVAGGKVIETYSSAMDIQQAYNIERLLYFTCGHETVAKIMTETESLGKAIIRPELLTKLKTHIKGAMKVDVAKTLETIKNCWTINNYLVCPHTATAVAYFIERESRTSTNKTYVISTASPEKFPDAFKAAEIPNIDSLEHPSTGKGGKGVLKELMSRDIKQPKTMRKGEDWYTILQAEIKLVQSQASKN